MSDVTITVRGEHEVRIAPERAIIQLSVGQEGADREAVVARALALAAPVREGLVAREAAQSIAEWSSTRLSVRAERPWNSEGKRLAVVYTATVSFTATFSDLSELSVWATEVAVWDGVTIGGTHWQLTPETRARVEREVAASAVGVAVARATAYAEALGRQTVEPVEIADVGLISSPGASSGSPMPAMRAAAFSLTAVDAPAMEFQPDDIVVAATVEGRFLAC
ncbi:uncharacterized protein YggE [Microbacterium resistens]|uniref:Uncharacterized protein YggE n=1 Tax=Microbacterium resistens TaxID=156977 RepID=A0ABU1S9A8_9MICO|nr:SIMPL domain-containing protein [Microbacterium resistens]MDR6865848.1 uncharacterized protein YggE [Microbacterium resistens]